MPSCTYCGKSTVNYVEYSVGGTFCSPQHRSYNDMRTGRIAAGDTRVTEERNGFEGQSNAGYRWKPNSGGVYSTTDLCSFCGTGIGSYKEYYKNFIYCSPWHKTYHQQKLGEIPTVLSTEEANCRDNGSHKGYGYIP